MSSDINYLTNFYDGCKLKMSGIFIQTRHNVRFSFCARIFNGVLLCVKRKSCISSDFFLQRIGELNKAMRISLSLSLLFFGFQDESGPKHQDMTGGNKGSLVKEDKSRATRQRINVDIAVSSKNSKAANPPTGKLPEGRNAGENICTTNFTSCSLGLARFVAMNPR